MEEVLLHTENVKKATVEIKAVGGRVKIQMGRDLLIADVPANVAMMQSFVHSSTHISNSVSQRTQINAKVYRMYRENLLKPEPEIQKWTDKSALTFFPRTGPTPENAPYPRTTTGKIAIAACNRSQWTR